MAEVLADGQPAGAVGATLGLGPGDGGEALRATVGALAACIPRRRPRRRANAGRVR